jgi:putative endonuclease
VSGRRGETAAADWLAERGIVILERNCRNRWGEIDLIGQAGELLLFFEVRSRRTDAFGRPAETVNHRKRTKLRQLAAIYLSKTEQWDRPCRFDVVGILTDDRGDVREIEWVQDAF